MHSYTFTRNQMAIGASSAIVMLVMIFSIIVPYLYSELRGGRTLMGAPSIPGQRPPAQPPHRARRDLFGCSSSSHVYYRCCRST
jgi:hypothetical protein